MHASRTAKVAKKATQKPQATKKVTKKVVKRNLTTKRTALPKSASIIQQSKRTVVTELTDRSNAADFIATHSKEKKLVVVDFFADWCGPCKKLAPQFEKMSDDFNGAATFAKVNADELTSSEINKAFPEVTALPTIMFFVDNQAVEKIVGADTAKIQATIQKYKSSV
jgi:thioredoxin 1